MDTGLLWPMPCPVASRSTERKDHGGFHGNLSANVQKVQKVCLMDFDGDINMLTIVKKMLTLQLHGHSWPIPPSELPFVQLPNISVQLQQICPNKLQKPRVCTDLFSTFNQLTITFISTAITCADAAWMVGRTVGLLVFPQVRCYSVVWIMLNSMRTHQSSRLFLCIPMVFPCFSHGFPMVFPRFPNIFVAEPMVEKCGAGEFWPRLLSPGRSADLGTGVERIVNSLGVVLPMNQAYWWWLLSKEV